MSSPLAFEYCTASGYPGEIPGYPSVTAELSQGSVMRKYIMYLDTGAANTVLGPGKLAPFGFDPPDEHAVARAAISHSLEGIGCLEFAGAGGSSLIGYGIDVNVSIVGGPQFVDLTVYGIIQGSLSREIIGRDFFNRYMSAFSLDREQTYFTPY